MIYVPAQVEVGQELMLKIFLDPGFDFLSIEAFAQVAGFDGHENLQAPGETQHVVAGFSKAANSPAIASDAKTVSGLMIKIYSAPAAKAALINIL